MPDYEVTLDGRRFVLTGDHPPTEDEARSAIGIKPVASHEQAKAPERTWADTAKDLLPTAGGVAGGVIGGAAGPVGAVAGAGLGGMWGEAMRKGLSPDTGQSVPEAAGDVAAQGAIQAGSEVGGRVIGAGLKAGAGRLYQSALKPTMAARAEYPNLVKTGLAEAIPVSKGGAEKAAGLVTKSKGAADTLVSDRQTFLQRLGPQAATIDPKQAVGGITKAVQDVQELPVARPQMQAIGDYGRAYIREHPQPISLTDAQSSIRATDRFYNSAYRATMDRGNPVTAGNTAAALGINDETRALLRARVPGLVEQNANTSALHGVQEAVERRTSGLGNNNVVGMHHAISGVLGGGAAAIGGRDKGLETFAIAEALTNPAIASRLAIGAAKAGSSGVSAQALRQALISLMASHAVEGN